MACSQLALDFDKPRARNSDPVSSHLAASALAASGVLSRQRRIVLAALKEHGPCTSAELAARSGLERHLTARRLPELREMNLAVQGPVRACSVARPGCEWRAA